MNVAGYLDRASRTPWAWGGGADGWRGHDCTLFAANWAVSLGFADPAVELRGSYDTREAAEAIVERAGGFVPLMAARLVSIGWKSVDEPREGDLGVISVDVAPGRLFQLPVVHAFGSWVSADPRRLLRFPDKFHRLMVWRAP